MSAAPSARGSYRRTKLGAIAALGAMATVFFATGGNGGVAAAQASIDPGQGLAIAQTGRVDPRVGALPIGPTIGISIAGHQNTVAQASSQAIDLGVVGTTLASEGCDGSDPTLPADKQPQPLQVDSRDPSAAQGKDADESAAPVPIHKHAMANPTPYGEATTTTAGYSIPGVLTVGPGVSHTTSGLVENGTQRQATASTDISSINLATVVQLTGLHWEAVWNSTGGAQAGAFTIGAATIGGKPVPTQDPMQTITSVNQSLAPLGIVIDPPKTRTVNGVQFVDPMGISIVPSQQRDTVAGTLLGPQGIQPVREQLFDALLKQNCSLASPITIFDIVLGSVTGAGSFNLILGGVQASSGEIPKNQFQLGTFALGAPPSLSTSSGAGALGGSTKLGTPATPGAPGSPGTAAGAPAGTRSVSPVAALAVKGKRGGALAGVGLASLGFLAALAEGDRRKMRRAQREIPQFTV